MGAEVGRQAAVGGATVRWVGAGRSAQTRQRAAQAGLQECPDLASALDGADVVLSICPPAAAEQVARAVRGYSGVYVEANAVEPARALRIAAILAPATVVDGGIIGEPPRRPGTTRLYLSGPAGEVPELFAGSALDVVLLPGGIGQASALKLAYASYQKTSRVLAAVAHALARRHGVGSYLEREARLLNSFPLAESEEFPVAAAKAWRWGPELREVAALLDADGLPAGLADATAAALGRWSAVRDRTDLDVDAVLDMLGQADTSDRRA